MTKNLKINTDEINLTELLLTLWESKWKIAAAVVIPLIATIYYQLIQTNNFTAMTEIRPIGSLEMNRYLNFNNLITNADTNVDTNANADTNADTNNNTNVNEIKGKFSKLTSSKFLNLYIDVLNDKSVFEDAIHKFNLLEASQYNNDKEYNEAIIRLASSIKILSPLVSSKEKKGNLETSYHTINFTYHDAEKWKNVLIYVDELANKRIKKNILEEYYSTFSFLKDKQKFKLEDTLTEIDNLYIDYDIQAFNRISYLTEQSEIAKKLGIKKNTIEVETFSNQNVLLSNINIDSPFYLRGYEAIDKEIELIKSRDNKKAFIKGLFELEQKKRAIEEDKTLERIKLIFQSTLSEDDKSFFGASINAITTKFLYKNVKKPLGLAIVIGLITGIFYVLISNVFKSLKVIKKN
jgi:LPS O-antigen subunit length determinant protein (WzzB/FepE family)